MAIRTFVFCDICNHGGIRNIERRDMRNRENKRGGRRYTDGRAWFDGPLEEATQQAGWLVTESGQHVCTECRKIQT